MKIPLQWYKFLLNERAHLGFVIWDKHDQSNNAVAVFRKSLYGDLSLTIMWYHAITDLGQSKRYWWNRSRDDLIRDLLVPLLNRQVVLVSRRGAKSLFNFGSVSYMTILKTKRRLNRSGQGKIPDELTDQHFIDENNSTAEFVNEVKILSSSKQIRSLVERSLEKPLKQIFVIMKFADEQLNSAYEGVIKPVGNEFGYNVLRVDEIQDSGNITQQILENISISEIILAELSGESPDCYYEAGFAHALGREIIFSIRKNHDIPFDLAGHRFITWCTEAEFRRKLKERLRSYNSKEGD